MRETHVANAKPLMRNSALTAILGARVDGGIAWGKAKTGSGMSDG
jgi:hypothetical protein